MNEFSCRSYFAIRSLYDTKTNSIEQGKYKYKVSLQNFEISSNSIIPNPFLELQDIF
jgi:hypothetical protein